MGPQARRGPGHDRSSRPYATALGLELDLGLGLALGFGLALERPQQIRGDADRNRRWLLAADVGQPDRRPDPGDRLSVVTPLVGEPAGSAPISRMSRSARSTPGH